MINSFSKVILLTLSLLLLTSCQKPTTIINSTVDQKEEELIEQKDDLESEFILFVQLNTDTYAYLKIEGTSIAGAVMNSDKYLFKDINKKYSNAGLPFIDQKNKEEKDVLIIYGHSGLESFGFDGLINYVKDETYLARNNYIETYSQENGHETWQIFAVCLMPILINEFDYTNYTSLKSLADYQTFINYIRKYDLSDKSILLPDYGQRILILSTCYNYRVNPNIRLLIVGKLVS